MNESGMSPGWIKSHIWMSHVTHRICDDFKSTQDKWQSHVTYRRVISNIAMSHEWVMSHTYMSHITHGICDDSRGTHDKWKNYVTYREVTSHVWTSHGSVVSHMNNLGHTYEQIISHMVVHMCDTYVYVSHICTTHLTHGSCVWDHVCHT